MLASCGPGPHRQSAAYISSQPVLCIRSVRQAGIPLGISYSTVTAYAKHAAFFLQDSDPTSFRMAKSRGKKHKQSSPGSQRDGSPRGADSIPWTPSSVLLCCHPSTDTVAVGFGNSLKLYSSRSNDTVELLASEVRTDGAPAALPTLQAMAFSASGDLFMAGGDDKTVRLWRSDDWRVICRWRVPKRISAVSFSNQGDYAFFADKFGDVHAAHASGLQDAATTGQAAADVLSNQALPPTRLNRGDSTASTSGQPALLLGHFCSIITSLTVSKDGKYVVTTDRDNKVRVSNIPDNPLQSAPNIQSYCLGHTAFAACSAFVGSGGRELLLSGSGDGTIRLWDHVNGAQLAQWTAPLPAAAHAESVALEPDENGSEPAQPAGNGSDAGYEPGSEASAEADGPSTREIAALQAEPEPDDGEDDFLGPGAGSPSSTVLALAASADGQTVAVVVEGIPVITLLTVDVDRPALTEVQRLDFAPGASVQPVAVSFDARSRLWAAALRPSRGVELPVALQLWRRQADGHYQAHQRGQSSADLDGALQKALADHPVPAASAADDGSTGVKVSQHLRKKVYSEQEVLARKKYRKDRKLS